MKKTTIYFLNSSAAPTEKALLDGVDYLQNEGPAIEQVYFDAGCESQADVIAETLGTEALAWESLLGKFPEGQEEWPLAKLGAILQGMILGEAETLLLFASAERLAILMKIVTASEGAMSANGPQFVFSTAGFSKVHYDAGTARWTVKYHNQTVEDALFARVEDLPKPADVLVTLVRHGESEGNVLRLFQGAAEYPLTARGVGQAEQLRDVFATRGIQFDQALCSPLERAYHTAKILTEPMTVDLIVEPLLQEVDNGKIAGMKIDEWLTRKPDVPEDRFEPIGETGESWWDLYLRAGAFVNARLATASGHVGCVTHGGFLRSIFKQMMGVSGLLETPTFFWIVNCATHQFAYDRQTKTWQILHINTQRLMKDED